MKHRMDYLDALRFIAIYPIFMTHFIDFACPQYFDGTGPFLAAPVSGLNSSSGVMMFCVLLGFFAGKTRLSMEQYMIKRFLQFSVMPCVLYLFLYGFSLVMQRFLGAELSVMYFTQFNPFHLVENLQRIFGNVILLTTDVIFPVLWCLNPFFFASVSICLLSKLLHKQSVNVQLCVALVITLLFFCVTTDTSWGEPRWIAFCYLGYCFSLVREKDVSLFHKQWFCNALCLVLMIVFARMPINPTAFVWQSVMLGVFVLACTGAPLFQKVLSFPPLTWLGKITFYIYMWHMVGLYGVYEIMVACGYQPFMNDTTLWVYCLSSAGASIALSAISYYAYDVLFTKWALKPLLSMMK